MVGGTRVDGLVRDGDEWHVRAAGGRLTADRVVVATTVADAQALLPELAIAPEAERRRVALVTLVLDAPALDAAPRGTGVLAGGGVTRAKALTHATAKWGWLRETADGLHVVRLSYALPDPTEDVAAHAVDDAARLLGVALSPAQVRASRTVVWDDASPARVPDRSPMQALELVGSAAGLSGLAAIVGAERARPRA